MKVAFVANTSWNIFNFRKGLVQFFLDRGDNVYVLAPRDEYSQALIDWGAAFYETPLQGTGTNPVNDLAYLSNLIKLFNRLKPDVSLSYTIKANIYTSIAGKLTGVNTICNVSGLGTVFLVKGLTGKIAILLYKFAFKFSSFIFFQNPDDQEYFLSQIKINKNKTDVLPGSGINLKEYEYCKPEIKVPVKILMISRVIVEKGVQEFALAGKYLDHSKAKLTLVGKYDENHARAISKVQLENWIENKYLDYLPHTDDIKKLISENELIILPSYREGTPRTLLEGAAIGRALLAANTPGCKEVVDDKENGFLFSPKNHHSIVEAINKYLSLSYEEKEQMSLASRKFVENKYDESLVINKYLEAIDLFHASDQ